MPELSDAAWMCDYGFLIDITQHLNHLNKQLQGCAYLIYELFELISAFEIQLHLWKTQLRSVNYAHFPLLIENFGHLRRLYRHAEIVV